VLRAWAVAHGDGADVKRLEQLTDRWLASDRASRLEDDGARTHLGGARYSTPEMLALEQRLIADAPSDVERAWRVSIPRPPRQRSTRGPT
jgi:hypothetical protein